MQVTRGRGPSLVGVLGLAVVAWACGADEQTEVSEESAFDRSQVLASGEVGGWTNVDFLMSEAPVEEARACVQEYLYAAAVACYAFSTREDYAAAQAAQPGNFTETCYEARWSRNKDGTQGGGLNRFKTSGCPGRTVVVPEERPESAASPDSLRVDIEMTHVLEGSQFFIIGLTNLPDGTVLSTSVSDGVGYMGQASTSVRDGAFQAGPFSMGGRPLPPGQYEIGVTVPFFNAQPTSVRRRLGDRLQYITGPLTRSMPMESLGKVASVRATIRIP